MSVLVGGSACDFWSAAVMPDNTIEDSFNFRKYVNESIGVLFFYPLDFTFVCPSEIIALNNKLEEFEKRNAKVIVVSVDSQFTHLAYKNTPVDKGGIGCVKFPMVSDLTKGISTSYGVLHDNSMALRGTFIIDDTFTVRHQLINDFPFGRNIEEILRIVDAIIFNKKHGEVCPANWKSGTAGMKATTEGVAEYLRDNASEL
ncbi:Alkyl hydroperoxide reductase C [Alphaproteobacteria bacterium]